MVSFSPDEQAVIARILEDIARAQFGCILPMTQDITHVLRTAISPQARSKRGKEIRERFRQLAKDLNRLSANTKPSCNAPSCSNRFMPDGSSLLICARCKKAYYCSAVCQKASVPVMTFIYSFSYIYSSGPDHRHWLGHRLRCQPVTTTT